MSYICDSRAATSTCGSGNKWFMIGTECGTSQSDVYDTLVKNSGTSSYCYSSETIWYTEGYCSEKLWYAKLVLLQ
jgi:hypothetical protein